MFYKKKNPNKTDSNNLGIFFPPIFPGISRKILSAIEFVSVFNQESSNRINNLHVKGGQTLVNVLAIWSVLVHCCQFNIRQRTLLEIVGFTILLRIWYKKRILYYIGWVFSIQLMDWLIDSKLQLFYSWLFWLKKHYFEKVLGYIMNRFENCK